MCIVFVLTHFALQCSEWRAPQPWPDIRPTVTTEDISASMSTDSTTIRYIVDQPRERIEAYYTAQMQQLCRPYEITPFETIYDQFTNQTVRRAACLVRGRSVPTPNRTPNQFENDMDYRAAWYEAIKGTNQRFQIDIYTLSPTRQEIVHDVSLSCP
jgi:hypothetical protein